MLGLTGVAVLTQEASNPVAAAVSGTTTRNKILLFIIRIAIFRQKRFGRRCFGIGGHFYKYPKGFLEKVLQDFVWIAKDISLRNIGIQEWLHASLPKFQYSLELISTQILVDPFLTQKGH